MRVFALVLMVASAASAVRAQSYTSSPHVVGDGASVRVYYDQKVNHTHVKKEVFVYQGPKTEDVLSAIRQIVDARQSDLIDKDDMKALRDEVIAQLHHQFRQQPDVLAAIRQLAPAPARHCGHWSFALGLSSIIAGGPGLGGHVQAGGHLDVSETATFRQAIGVRLGLEILERTQYTPGGLNTSLGGEDRRSSHGWIEPTYELYWLKGHLALQVSALLGAQTFEAGVGDRYTISYGLALAPELRIGTSNGTGVSIGIKYRAASMTRPVFPYEGFVVPDHPERALQHFILLYAGMYFGFFGS